jgi:hypothetical protein
MCESQINIQDFLMRFSASVVMVLMDPFGIDVILYTDNYYTECEPENQHNKGTHVCRKRESTNKIMYVQFEDKREVCVLTNEHASGMVRVAR